jgi:hypothetical protein
MLKRVFKLFLHLVISVLLTVITQIGGVLYLISVLALKRKKRKILSFITLYILSTFLLVPLIAPIFGREKINNTNNIEAQTFFTKITNRNYVKPELNKALISISEKLAKKHKGLKLIYLDANFPFIDKFPLLPHLSHNDGKKIDVSFIYENENNTILNKKPSISGYGVYESPTKNEYNQPNICLNKGYWQYDFPKYLTFGTINKELNFSEQANKDLIYYIFTQPSVSKIFIEPHLKNRLKLNNSKIRFHGCQAVRHDDHIHFQIK